MGALLLELLKADWTGEYKVEGNWLGWAAEGKKP